VIPQAVIALDLGGTKLAAALVLYDGTKLGHQSTPLSSRTGVAVGKLVVDEIQRVRQLAKRRHVPVKGVGICVPGIVTRKTGRVWAPNIAGWDDYPLRAEVRAALDNPKLKVVVESDRAASVLGEAWHGAACGCRNVVFLAVGTGIGAGILVDGRVLNGANGIGGAVGWLAVDRPFQSQYVERGCFERHASGDGLAIVARDILQRNKKYRGPLRDLKSVTARHVFSAYEKGDEVAKAVIDQAIEFWGMASANLISLFNPEKIIFGGGLFGPAAKFIDAIEAEARRWAQPIAIQQVTFEASALEGDAALLGAAYSALRAAGFKRLDPKGAK
jgi:glucokinase